LLRAQNYLKGTTLLNLEESNNVAQFYGFRQLLDDQILTPNEVIKQIEAVTVKDLNRLAKLIFQKEQLRFALIGNFANAKEIRQWVFD